MINLSSSFDFAKQLDQQDSLASYREQFVVNDPDLIYLDGNSLGRLPKSVIERMKKAVEEEWGTDLIRGWNKGWWESPSRIGDKLATLLGAADREAQVVVGDQTSINLFKLATAALTLQPQKKRIITDTFNFPSDLYILQGIVKLLGDHHEIIRIGAMDNDITPDLARLEASIDENTTLVTLSHVTFKSGYLYDMAYVTELAHRQIQRRFCHWLHLQISQWRTWRARIPLRKQVIAKRCYISHLGLVGTEKSIRVRPQLSTCAGHPAIFSGHSTHAFHAGNGGSADAIARCRHRCATRQIHFDDGLRFLPNRRTACALRLFSWLPA